MKIKSVTQHAVDRFLERSGGKKEVRATNQLFAIAEQSIPIGGARRYAKGWIVVVKKGVVRTCYKPRTTWDTNAVFKAVNSHTK